MLDERLQLAASLYEPCDWGADIGTDHGLLPCSLLEEGICGRMILGDISEPALSHARLETERRGLTDRAILRAGNGLQVLDRPCGCISITGMGGDTVERILKEGKDRLQGAVLVLSAHSCLPALRRGVRDIGYHFTREIVCRAAGRFYMIWRAEPGEKDMTDSELLFGTHALEEQGCGNRRAYLLRLLELQERQERGLEHARVRDEALLHKNKEGIRYLEELLHEGD